MQRKIITTPKYDAVKNIFLENIFGKKEMEYCQIERTELRKGKADNKLVAVCGKELLTAR